MITHDPEIAAHAKRVVMIRDGERRKRGDNMKVVKRIIVGVLIVTALASAGIYTGLMHVKESKVTEVPVTSVSNLMTDWYSETTLDGTITTNVAQNVNMDKDMIIEKIYVSQGDDVKKETI